jgi:hypothetical protein
MSAIPVEEVERIKQTMRHKQTMRDRGTVIAASTSL